MDLTSEILSRERERFERTEKKKKKNSGWIESKRVMYRDRKRERFKKGWGNGSKREGMGHMVGFCSAQIFWSHFLLLIYKYTKLYMFSNINHMFTYL